MFFGPRLGGDGGEGRGSCVLGPVLAPLFILQKLYQVYIVVPGTKYTMYHNSNSRVGYRRDVQMRSFEEVNTLWKDLPYTWYIRGKAVLSPRDLFFAMGDARRDTAEC